MLKIIHDYFENILSYVTALMAIALSLPLMQIGGAILLVSRLIVDVPPAIKSLRRLFNRIFNQDIIH